MVAGGLSFVFTRVHQCQSVLISAHQRSSLVTTARTCRFLPSRRVIPNIATPILSTSHGSVGAVSSFGGPRSLCSIHSGAVGSLRRGWAVCMAHADSPSTTRRSTAHDLLLPTSYYSTTYCSCVLTIHYSTTYCSRPTAPQHLLLADLL